MSYVSRPESGERVPSPAVVRGVPGHEGLVGAAVKLRKSWSPGPAVDAFVEILRASSLRRLARTAESVRAAVLGPVSAESADPLLWRDVARAAPREYWARGHRQRATLPRHDRP
ncbi:hypothetical protein SAMN05216553_106181 [Lentzea fradiae]|uniref:Uncharacterized protein n=1 Tax=Lentzea fradiae TaxID=200378 RepID=A0A1G7SF73_9PSEU|nr:hypothetical protein [Lentzea fradiae]SDG20840.1 hypothetical protein SAMN05216553_106181 [Lentzea fradiae]